MTRTRLFRVRAEVDAYCMEPTFHEQRLHDVQCRIEALYRARGTDNFNLPARYQGLVKLEAILLDQLNVPNDRRQRELTLVGR